MVTRSLVWKNDAKQQKLFLGGGGDEQKKSFCFFHIMSMLRSSMKESSQPDTSILSVDKIYKVNLILPEGSKVLQNCALTYNF